MHFLNIHKITSNFGLLQLSPAENRIVPEKDSQSIQKLFSCENSAIHAYCYGNLTAK